MGKENDQERLRKEAELKVKIRKDAAEDLTEIVKAYSYLLGKTSEALWRTGIHGSVFELLAKHDPSIPDNEEENLKSLDKFVLGLMGFDSGWVYNGKHSYTSIPDRLLMSYQSETQRAIITGVVEIKIDPKYLKEDKSVKFRRNPLKPLKGQFEKINQFLRTSAKGFLISPPVTEIVLRPPEETKFYLVVPRGTAETGTIRFTRWEIAESIFTVEEIKSITKELFASSS